MGRAIGRFLRDLSDGDPVAVGLLIAVLVVAAGIGLFVLKTRRDLRREDEAKAKSTGENRRNRFASEIVTWARYAFVPMVEPWDGRVPLAIASGLYSHGRRPA